MLPDYLSIHRRARGAFENLAEDERARVLAAFEALAQTSPDSGISSATWWWGIRPPGGMS
jgi:hypothetical protein